MFSATWIHRPAYGAAEQRFAPGWSTVSDEQGLAAWNALHDTTDVLLPPLLRRGHFRILARYDGGQLVAGAVARLGSGVVEVSNVFAVPGHQLDWSLLASAMQHLWPGRPFVGYERGDRLREAESAGFAKVGPMRVWVR